MSSVRNRVCAVLVAACAGLAFTAAPGHAVSVGVSADTLCSLSVTAPGPIDRISQAYLHCPTASTARPLTATMTVCAQRLHGFITGPGWQMAWTNHDGCQSKTGTIDSGTTPVTLRDYVPCGTLPLYRGISSATISGYSGTIRAESEERPGLAC